MEHHRPGPLKQNNKKHNAGKHRTKGQLEKVQKGKVAIVQSSKHKRALSSKQDRRNRNNQLRKTKREELQYKKRGIGGERSPPHYVAIITLSNECSSDNLLKLLKECDDQATVTTSPQGFVHVSYPRFKQRVAYILPNQSNLAAVLESVRISDSVLFLWSLQDFIDEEGEKLYSCLYAQGLPSAAHAVMGVKGIPHKKQGEIKKIIGKEIEDRFTDGKVHLTDTEMDAQLLVRFLSQQKIKVIKSREMRPHVVAERLEFEANTDNDSVGTLKVTGFLRGPSLTVNRLVHIPGYGDFQMNKITAPTDPHPLVLKPGRIPRDAEMAEEEPALLAEADPNRQEDLTAENAPNPLEGEQTWPTEDELAEATANAALEKKKTVVKVPKGTSSYQAAWIVDAQTSEQEDESDESDDDMDDDDEDMEADDGEDDSVASDEGDEFEDVDTGSVAPSVTWADDAKYDQQMDLDQEEAHREKYREERENEQFPDEVDTPEDMPARVRFARYRGLKSFRTSPWDPKENLPIDYARIFQFENFTRFRKHIVKQELSDGIVSGWYITVEVKNVPKEVFDAHSGAKGSPLTLVGLFPNEQRMSVLNFTVRRHHLFTDPVKSKERLIIQVGFRRFECNPIFSDHSNIDKHKYERFLPKEGICVMSTYAPITFPPASVMVFRQSAEGHDLVASGSMLSVDPDRRVIKRIVLSGHPFKINKKSAVIRYMFYNRDDIEWFKPVELKTKWGRRGHIKEGLGTHGHMKCVFDQQLRSQDTPLLLLYKRVFPKWTYSGYIPAVSSQTLNGDHHMDDGVTEEERKQLFS